MIQLDVVHTVVQRMTFISLIQSDDYAGDDLSTRLLQQGAQYFSAVEGDSDTEEERSTLRADRYMLDADQPKLALAEDSVRPSPATEKQPPPQADEYHGKKLLCVCDCREDHQIYPMQAINIAMATSIHRQPQKGHLFFKEKMKKVQRAVLCSEFYINHISRQHVQYIISIVMVFLCLFFMLFCVCVCVCSSIDSLL